MLAQLPRIGVADVVAGQDLRRAVRAVRAAVVLPARGDSPPAADRGIVVNGTGVASVRYEYKLSSGSTWNTACTGATTPFSSRPPR